MKYTKQFIEDAIEGGYEKYKDVTAIKFHKGTHLISLYEDTTKLPDIAIEELLLDPLAWQSVGKTRGWHANYIYIESSSDKVGWGNKWHSFIDHLADGKSIEEALEAIS